MTATSALLANQAQLQGALLVAGVVTTVVQQLCGSSPLPQSPDQPTQSQNPCPGVTTVSSMAFRSSSPGIDKRHGLIDRDGAWKRWQVRPAVGAPEAGVVGGHGATQVSRGPVLLAPPLPDLVLDGCRVQLLRDGLAAEELQREVGEDEAPRVAGKVRDGIGH